MKPTLLLAIALVLSSLPKQVMAVSLELRRTGDQIAENTIMVGDEFEVELWIDSENNELSGAAVFISFDPNHFEIIADSDNNQSILKPFLPGNFLSNGEIFRNYLLDESDPAASTAGIQLDYSIVRASDQGSGQLAKFGLRAISPTTRSEIKIDESGSRETRFFLPDGNHKYFRYIKPLAVQVQGISLNDLPDRIVLQRSETRNINLISHFSDPVFPIEDIEWKVSATDDITTILDQQNHTIHFVAPQDESPWQQVVITAKNPAGQFTSDTLNVFVNNPPVFEPVGKLLIKEDQIYELDLQSIVSDIDSGWNNLEWASETESKIDIQLNIQENKATISPKENWHGIEKIRLIATDNFSFSDTLQFEIEVEPINDPPTLLFEPNIRITHGRSDQTIRIEDLIYDTEDSYKDLRLTWTDKNNVRLEIEEESLTIHSDTEWYGTEEISLRVEDKEGYYSTGLLTVTVSPSIPPTALEVPSRIFITAGEKQIISLNNWVTDPDDEDKTLVWKVTGNKSVTFQINSQHIGLIDSPKEFVGMETLSFQVSDLTGETTTFTVDIYSLPPDGTPLFTKLPELQVPIDGINSSINLDEYIFDIDNDANDFSFSVPDHEMLNLRVDSQSHVLIIEPKQQAYPGTIDFQLHVSDPLGNQASQKIVIHILDTNLGNNNTFSLVALDTLNIDRDKTYTINLEKYIIGSSTVGPLNWRADLVQGINTEFNGNELTIHSTEIFLGEKPITIYASKNNGAEQRIQIHLIEIPANENSSLPMFLPTITLSLSTGAIDSSIFINDLLPEFETNNFAWEITGGNQTQATIDFQTNKIIVYAGEYSHNGEQFVLLGTRKDGIQAEAVLDVVVIPNRNNFLTENQYNANIFSDQKEIRIPIEHILLDADLPIGQINWQPPENGDITVFYDSVQTELVLFNPIPWNNNQEFELKATSSNGISATAIISTKIYDVNGDEGILDEDFSVIIVPNAFQPEFIDIFVARQKKNLLSPRLRVHQNYWSDIALSRVNNEIWHGRHAVKHGQEGEVTFMALMIDDSLLYRSQYAFELGSIQSGRGKLIANNNLSIDLNPGAFSSDAVVALLPDKFKENHPELVLVSPVYNIYSPQEYITNGSRLRMKIPPGTKSNTGLYQYANKTWNWIPSSRTNQAFETELNSLGRFALFTDSTDPKMIEEEGLNWFFADAGSGLSSVEVFHRHTPLNSDTYHWNGKRLSLNPSLLPASNKSLQIRVADNAGNVALFDIQIDSEDFPSTPILNQNFPNPFNPSTTIPITLSHRLPVRLEIFNVTGQTIRSLIDHFLEPGVHEITWDSRDDLGNPVSSGMYLYQLILPDRTLIRKMTLVR